MKKRVLGIMMVMLMVSVVFTTVAFAQSEEAVNTETVGVEYRGHIENYGDYPTDGSFLQGPNLLGTKGDGLRLEAFLANLTNAPEGMHLAYRVHVQDIGWMDWAMDGEKAGTQSRGLRVEAIEMKLVDDGGNMVAGYSVQYRGHVQNQGDLPANGTWYADGQTLGTTGLSLQLEAVEVAIIQKTDNPETAAVYMTTDISPEGMMAVYQALNWTPEGNVAIKLSTGEPPASNYLRPELIKDLVQSVDGTIVECNTAYGGSRGETEMHMQVAKDHGFTDIATVDIMDADGSLSLPVDGGIHLQENLVGSHFANYDSFIVLSHFKGHAMAGFGGAIKNISIGIGSQEGKSLIHTAGNSHTSPWGGNQDDFLESMADAGKSVSDSLDNGENIVYVNVMNRLSIDCDCSGNPAEPDIHDIGILASTDPVALDQACIDLIYSAEGKEALVNRIEDRNGLHMLESAEQIGLGTRSYQLESIDD